MFIYLCYNVVNSLCCFLFFFFNDTATTEIYTLSLHDALPILALDSATSGIASAQAGIAAGHCDVASYINAAVAAIDRKSTRLNSSHSQISYAVFCLKKKKKHSITASRHY